MHHSGKYSGRAVLWILLSALAYALVVSPGFCQDFIVPTDAISRELTVYNADDPIPTDAVSREITVYNGDDGSPTDAISREITVFNGDDGSPTDAVSREITVYNGDDGSPTEAVSREITVYNGDDGSPTDAVSREITVFNGDPSTATDAISREFTVLNRQLVDFRNKQDGEEVKILGNEGLAVTAEFSDCIYVQTPWSHIGIKVTGSTASVGDKVNIEGAMATDEDGNRYITATSVTTVGTRITSPSMMLTRTARCEGVGFEEPSTAGQRGATDGVGSCVIGLYVKMVGKVIESDGSLWLDDGGVPTVRLSAESTGIAASADVRVVTGIVTLKKVGDDYIPVLRASAVYTPVSGAPGLAAPQKRSPLAHDVGSK